ncbi:LysE family translocator [Nonomuraea sp. M3C6]|uniref:LysE family translocator n=1 Tax=Nonomuraea marmarensis TaxID=3351344 RepID=A0ABW7A4B1_9ACTN
MWVQLAAFVGLSIVVICTPGPDTALTVRNAFSGGRRGGVWTAAGVATGQAAWTVAASLGIAGLIHASEPAFLAFAWLTLYSLVIDKARALFDRSRVRRAMDAVAGTVLIAFGARLALSQR